MKLVIAYIQPERLNPVKQALFGRAADEGWTIVLSHEPLKPVGRLARDRDQFKFEALV